MQKLLDVALADMKKDGYQNIYLWVLKENKNAQLFYERNGFQYNQYEYNFEIMGKQLTDIRCVIDLN
ncbi:ribosomal protein S18 acetylase RimI-like enzyme [Clostridium tetanomorphum]|uniref:GNAT family N-acetyltransferase n=2 Tax=Clostridium tetanomorphum TaxID=1553 RepID=A0A923IYC8_CLOTT|nr:GNAT family N-acetyltransferase [Clostridium tetanomorphum]KAJ50188.1 GNAT family acetyltransferase [Clostridium tetanomorphum DSM 665]MBC2396251.1 GNAT family N-acetyltransferase [Clostridium tetanomorphum]MBP1864325.1 ribosomal protein S18 acetylase RimI-like enzyme [Clostridium tetanomorphum]NRS83771.1 ribosomal protein S18 acetylase RimI-like enzyme [Clostridium tetanomorphum]NRZ96962.1 ribosomal protein S18 acetylase RimI-like enzyme [Clostridium tetanomorphum]